MRSSWDEDEGPEGWGRLTSTPFAPRIRETATQPGEDLDRAGGGRGALPLPALTGSGSAECPDREGVSGWAGPSHSFQEMLCKGGRERSRGRRCRDLMQPKGLGFHRGWWGERT